MNDKKGKYNMFIELEHNGVPFRNLDGVFICQPRITQELLEDYFMLSELYNNGSLTCTGEKAGNVKYLLGECIPEIKEMWDNLR